jgi:putative hydrolase of the HAD superfamily
MIKAVFLDYTGTILQRRGPDMDELLDRVLKHSTLETKEEVFTWWSENMNRLEKEHYGDNFRSEDQLFLSLLDTAKMDLRFREDPVIMHTLIQNYWMYAPVYDDVREFLDLCPLPVYILSGNAREYVQVCLRRNRLHVNDIVSAEDVKAYKSHRELFDRAVKTAGCRPEEALYLGSSYQDDVKTAVRAGLRAVLLDRRSEHREEDCRRVRSLIELVPLIKVENEKENREKS